MRKPVRSEDSQINKIHRNINRDHAEHAEDQGPRQITRGIPTSPPRKLVVCQPP